jgi:hypothetical protein
MREGPDEIALARLDAAARDAMLVSCIRCGALHPPAHPLDFHPVCGACGPQRHAGDRGPARAGPRGRTA